MIRNVELSVFRFVAFGSNRGVPGEPPDDREDEKNKSAARLFSRSASYARTGNKSSAGPAPGYRHALYGTLYAVGNSGYSWASSVTTDSLAYNLYFNYGGIYPNDRNGRASGLQLRCLQE
ncbi:MAG: hypothetical protein K2G93_08110 [Rikenella sp.]|nr:hypothetical protein [Rikenella sp.]